MNEYNKQWGYLSVLNKNNPYIDDITFDPAKSKEMENQQIHYVFIRFAQIANIIDVLFVDSPLYRNLRYELKTFPSKYNITFQTFSKASVGSAEIINNIALAYNEKDEFNKKILSSGLTLLNENCYNDIKNGKINIKALANGFNQMYNTLSPVAPIISKDSSGTTSEKGNS